MKQRLLALLMTLTLTAALLPTTLAAGELPGYYGDQSQCKMTVQQARTYAELLQQENNKLRRDAYSGTTPRGYAALVDTGSGMPALIWLGVIEEFDLCDVMTCSLWQFQSGKLVLAQNPYISEYDDYQYDDYCGIRIYDDRILLDTSADMSASAVVYPYENGLIAMDKATKGSDMGGIENVPCRVDGKTVSDAVYSQWRKTWIREDAPLCGAKCYTDAEVSGFADAAAMVTALNAYQGPANTAYASTQSVNIDGKAVTFQMYALKNEAGNLTNYVKVRDLAAALDGTKAQFNVGWNGAVNIETGKPYTTRNGQEGKTPYSGDRAYQKNSAVTNVNGAAADLQAFVLTDDNGGQSTYYKLRDLGRALGFNVGWNAKGVFLETDKPYTDAD